MTTQTLDHLFHTLRDASAPEDIFGSSPALSADELKQRYRELLKQVHPDFHPGAPREAAEAFAHLQAWYAEAQAKLAQGFYARKPVLEIITASRVYKGNGDRIRGDICDLFAAWSDGQAVLVKAARHPRNNDLLEAEAQSLRRLQRATVGDPLAAHFPTLLESIHMRDPAGSLHRANALLHHTDTVTLAQVLAAHPRGVDLADAAWMFNRLIAALGVAHGQGIVHGGVTPDHLLLRLADHNGILIDWCYSVEEGERVPGVSLAWQPFAPPEVMARQPATPASDIYAAANCLIALLGGDVKSGALPPTAPATLHALLRACLLTSPHRRVQDAWQLFDDFREILERLYGPPRFREFTMPGE